jgi:hypothetical protein
LISSFLGAFVMTSTMTDHEREIHAIGMLSLAWNSLELLVSETLCSLIGGRTWTTQKIVANLGNATRLELVVDLREPRDERRS